MKSQYKKIHLQTLSSRPQVQTYIPQQKQLIQHMNGQFQWSDCPVLCYLDSAISKQRTVSQQSMFRQNHFFNAFLYAYTQHGDILLVPDQIWIMISFYLSTYIDKNAQRLRKKIVSHSGVKTLTVVEQVSSPEQSLVMEKNWNYFFDKIIGLIEKETINGIVPALSCDFTTTTKTYKIISTAIIMNSFKKYFNYHRMLAGCGINNVYMAGTRQDWQKMITKLDNLVQFDVDGQLKKYIKYIKIILTNFLLTFDQKPDVAWWNTIMTTPDKRQIYGGQSIQVQGWILHFLGLYQKHVFEGFPQFAIKVPIKLINLLTNTQKSLLLVSDFVSVSKLNQRTYKPDVGLSIFAIRNGPSKMQKLQKQIKAYTDKKKITHQFIKMNKISIGMPMIQSPIIQKKSQKSRAYTVKKPVGLRKYGNNSKI